MDRLERGGPSVFGFASKVGNSCPTNNLTFEAKPVSLKRGPSLYEKGTIDMTLQTKPNPLPHSDLYQLNGIDYVEFYVGNAKQAIHFYRTAFGFKPVAFCGFETGMRDRVSFVGQQQGIRLM